MSTPPVNSSTTPETQVAVVAAPRQVKGVLADLVAKNDVYHEVLQFVLQTGGPGLGFDELPSDPMSIDHIAATLQKASQKLLSDAKSIVMPSLSALVQQNDGLNEQLAQIRSSSNRALSHDTFQFSPAQQEHYDDAVYFVTLATSENAIDNVIENVEHQAIKRNVLDAVLYGMSLMCRYPVNPELEDEAGRSVLEVMMQGIVSLLVNLDVLLDLQFLNSVRGCRICDIIRWLHSKGSKAAMMSLGAALSIMISNFCFPRLPADIVASAQACRHRVDAIRRTYCGYQDGASVIKDLIASLRSLEHFDSFKDVAFMLDHARESFLPRAIPVPRGLSEASPHLSGDMPDTTQESPDSKKFTGRREESVEPVDDNVLGHTLLIEKQNPWMVAGPARELHYIATVALRLLEDWLPLRCEQDKRLFFIEDDYRTLIRQEQMYSHRRIERLLSEQLFLSQQKQRFNKGSIDILIDEMKGRREIEMHLEQRVTSILQDLRTLKWHVGKHAREQQLFGAHPIVLPRLYFIELAELTTIDEIEEKQREDELRKERFAFSALREQWNSDFQVIQEILAQDERERQERDARRRQMMEEADKQYEESRSASRLKCAPLSASANASRAQSAMESPSSRPPTSLAQHEYYNPHSSTVRSDSVMSGVLVPPVVPSNAILRSQTKASRPGTSTSFVGTIPELRADSPPKRHSVDVPSRQQQQQGPQAMTLKSIHVGTRVVSPDLPQVEATVEAMLQDLFDDQEIERALLEDEESNKRKEAFLDYKDGKVMRFDWSMNGYRRVISSLAATPGFLPGITGESLTASRLGMRTPAGGKDPERHLPTSLRSAPVNRVLPNRTPSALNYIPQPPAAQQQFMNAHGAWYQSQGYNHQASIPRLATSPSPLPMLSAATPNGRLFDDSVQNYLSGMDEYAMVPQYYSAPTASHQRFVKASRPQSNNMIPPASYVPPSLLPHNQPGSLVDKVFFAPEPPQPKFGYSGTATPDLLFMPRTFSRQR